uniref:DUF4604 domain-containing protein n=1 Tax=Parastrongyloides trichosuri TaxID=131310 RepID=A0A0N5A627_PARTI
MSRSKKDIVTDNHLDEKIDFVEFIKSTQRERFYDNEGSSSVSPINTSEENLKKKGGIIEKDKERLMKEYRKYSEETIRVGKIINPKKLFKSSKTCAVFNAIESIDDTKNNEEKSHSNSNPGILNDASDNEEDNLILLPKLNELKIQNKNESISKKLKNECSSKIVVKVTSEKMIPQQKRMMKPVHTVDHEDESIIAYFPEDISTNIKK